MSLENERMKRVSHYKVCLEKVISIWDEKEYAACIKEVDEVLATPGIPKAYLADFLYYRATSLDMSGDPESALTVLLELTDEFPGNHCFKRSTEITLSNLTEKARTLVQAEPSAPVLRNIWNVLQAVDSAPWWLTCEVARLDLKDGNPLEAKRKIDSLHALSPNDVDFLREALAMASSIGDEKWMRTLVKRVKELREKRPWQIDLIGLLPEADVEEKTVLCG